MVRRKFLIDMIRTMGVAVAAFPVFFPVFKRGLWGKAGLGSYAQEEKKMEKLVLSDEEWKKRLSEDEYDVLRKEGTERPFTSELNQEKREGIYRCVGCDLELFTSKMKFDSGTGWPSFFTSIEGAFETETDFKLIYPRTEYHCARCGGHHGHVFKDGPPPTGKRWCNNGIVLKFVPGKIDA